MKDGKKYIPRTDLALEARELVKDSNNFGEGIIVKEKSVENVNIRITDITITNDTVAKSLGKRVGEYITIEAPELIYNEDEYHNQVSKELKKCMTDIINSKFESYKSSSAYNNLSTNRKKSNKIKILIAGLGNRDATPDALGPMVVSNIRVTRHIEELGVKADELILNEDYIFSAIAPDVMAKTGMETVEIIKGIVERTLPDIVVVVDSLAARDTKRLGRTIQITDTGIAPGSGVMNKRKEINEEVLKVPVIAVGVPMVIDAVTIVYDTIKKISDEEETPILEEVLNEYVESMYVTPKDIDGYVKRISYTISEAINSMSSHKSKAKE